MTQHQVEPPTTTATEHKATYKRVVRIRGRHYFGFDVACTCGWKCSRHDKAATAARCAVRHEKKPEKVCGAVSQ